MAGCANRSDDISSTAQRELSRGTAAALAWRDSSSLSAALSLGYLERQRLGLGGPFRLIAYAHQDPRLDEAARTRLGWALLARVRQGQSFQPDPRVLDRLSGAAGAAHGRIIQQALAAASDPRAGELGLRIGYTIAEREALVREGAARTVAGITALLVDVALARDDAERLLRKRSDALGQVQVWRKERRFKAEQPRLGPLSTELELEATRIAQRTVQQLRTLALQGGAAEPAPAPHAALPMPVLARLDDLHRTLNYPPQTPIALVARRAGLSAGISNEESFMLEYQRTASFRSALPLLALQAAVAMRAYAQEPVWYPGMPGPSARELEELYGLASVTVDADVPRGWRPYYRTMLGSALEDLHRVLPATDLNGLRVRFGAVRGETDVLAMHDPRQRRLLLPLATSAGTLAHELAHDIDWQQALEKYRVHGDYATDRALRSRSDRFSRRVDALRTASLAGGSRNSTHAQRPAEIFARNVDWYVAVALAGQGRRNGYLSSVQDELITGYGTVRAPDVSGRAGDALMAVMNDLAPIYREQRDAFRAQYGSLRAPHSFDLVRALGERTLNGDLQSAFGALAAQRDSAQRALDLLPCGYPLSGAQLRAARGAMVDLMSEARARGIALRHMQREHGRAGGMAMMSRLYGGPYTIPAELRSAVDQLAARIESVKTSPAGEAAGPFALAANPAACGSASR